MHRMHRFCIADLCNILFSVSDRHANDVGVYMNVGGRLTALANELDTITRNFDVSDNLGAMAFVMAAVTIKVFKGAPIMPGPAEDQKVNVLTWQIRTDLSIGCAIYFAQSYGYHISPAQVDDAQISHVMLMEDPWEPLVGLFEEFLVTASLDAGGPHEIEDDVDESTFIEEITAREPGNRQLSRESFENLRSQAFQQRWTAAEVLMLIEAHLRPNLDPLALHYSSTISGEEWLNLHNCFNEPDADGSPNERQ